MSAVRPPGTFDGATAFVTKKLVGLSRPTRIERYHYRIRPVSPERSGPPCDSHKKPFRDFLYNIGIPEYQGGVRKKSLGRDSVYAAQ